MKLGKTSTVVSVLQNGGSIISYFGKHKKLWQEFDAIEHCTMEYANYIEKTTKGHGRVLATIPLPNLHIAYAMVCVEVYCLEAMLGGTPNEGAVMATEKIIFFLIQRRYS
ncbi:hypothetical protein WN943_014900 [Citrus x changshan-huyou]